MDYREHIQNLLKYEKKEKPIDRLMYEDTDMGKPVDNKEGILISYLECIVAEYVSHYTHENCKYENVGSVVDFQGTKYMEDLFLNALLNVYIYH